MTSVITPCYNAAGFVGQTISSVRAQTQGDWEHVVIDDGSTDGSVAATRSAAGGDRRVRVLTGPNGGVAAARNRGFAAASGDSRYLLFLDADDVLEPDMLRVMAGHLDRHDDVGMAYCGFRLIDERGDVLADDPQALGWMDRVRPTGWGLERVPPGEPATPLASVFTAAAMLPSITLIRRSVYEQTPGFDEAFGHVFEDLDLFIQIAIRSRVHYVAEPLVRYRKHAGQSTADQARLQAQQQKLWRKWRALGGLTPEQRREVDAALRFRAGRAVPYAGLVAARRHAARREFGTAARFAGGAAKRYVASFLPGFEF